MNTRTRVTLLAGLIQGLHTSAPAISELHDLLKDIPLEQHWIYDDLPKAVEQARATGRPLLAVFR